MKKMKLLLLVVATGLLLQSCGISNKTAQSCGGFRWGAAENCPAYR